MSREVGPRREALGRNRGFRVPFAGKLPDGLPIRFPSQSTKNPTKFSLAVFFFSLQILSESTIMDTTMCVMWGLAALLSTKRPVSRMV